MWLSVCLCALSPGAARAQDSAADLIAEANASLEVGDFERAEVSVRAIIGRVAASKEERAEAFRILGLLKFNEQANAEARAAFLEYLRLNPDAHLDPAMVTPEAITLLEDVRARNLAELDAYRQKPEKKRYLLLNLVPAAGQIQNGERTKGILLASGMGLLLATNLGSYFTLKSYCDEVDRTCSSGDEDRTATARNLQSVNVLSGIGLLSLYAYSVVDGYLGYKRHSERQKGRDHMSFQVIPVPGSTSVAFRLSF